MPTELTPVVHLIEGDRHQVRRALLAARNSRRLVGRPSLPVRLSDGRIQVQAVILEPAMRPAQSAVEARTWLRRHRTALVLAASAVGALAVLGYVLAVLLAWVVAHAAVLIGSGVILLGAAGVLRWVTRPSGDSGGMGWHYTKCGR